MDPGTFTGDQRNVLIAALGSRNCRSLQIFCKPVATGDVINKLERIALAVRRGEFDDTREANRAALVGYAGRFRTAGNHRLADDILNEIKPTRGRPEDMQQVRIAEAVGWVLLASGVRSRRSRELLPRSRSGIYAKSLAIVMHAGGVPVPVDILALIVKVAPHVEWLAMHDG